jgi:hypothetical protein
VGFALGFDGTHSMTARTLAGWGIRLVIATLLALVLGPVGVLEANGDAGPSADSAAERPQTMGAATKAEPFFGYGVDVELLGQPVSTLLNGVLGMQFNWVRQVVEWRQLEPAAGQYNWTGLDAAVYEVSNRGLHLMLLISDTPDWVETVGEDLAPGSHALPADLDAWTRFLVALVSRYDGLVDAYQVWGAPDLSAAWNSDSASSYVQLLRAAHQVIRSHSPGTLVVSAGLPADAGLGYLAAMYRAGLAAHCDAVAVSLGRATAGDYLLVRQVMAANGDEGKPVWLTGLGWPAATGDGACAPGVSEEQQADSLVGAIRMAEQEPSIQLVIVDNYNWSVVDPSSNGACFSLIRSDWSARPAFLELAQMRQEELFPGAGQLLGHASRRAPQAGVKPHVYRPDS